MNTYIATFFTHFDAISFARELHKKGLSATPMPVPRKLSSSCGTCVRFETNSNPVSYKNDGIEQIAFITDTGYELVLDNR